MGLRASGGRLAIRLSFGTVAIACVNCCVMIGKVYAALIYILISLYVFSVAFLVADAACSKISCKSNGHFFREKCGGRMSMYFWKRCCVFQASESDSDMFTCMSGAAGFIFCLCSVSAFSGRCRIYFLSDRTWKI